MKGASLAEPGRMQVAEPGRLEVRAASPMDREAWDTFVTGHTDSAGYHEWAWRGVFEDAFGHRTHYLMAWSREAVVGVLPLVEMRSFIFGRFLTSLPFVNYGGVLAESSEIASALVGSARDLALVRKLQHVELRHVGRQFENLPCRQHKVVMKLDLVDDIWNRFDKKVRNQIRKAEKSSLTAAEGGVELLDEFYAVFSRNMRDLGTPVYGRRLFERMLEAFPERTRLIIVRLGQQPVAAGLSYRTRRTVEVPWASSIRDFNSLCPNHLLYWQAIQSALAGGCDTLDFGRSTPGEGTYKFKAQWGALPTALHWEYCLLTGSSPPDQSPQNPKFQAAISIWQRLPLWLANLAGPRIVRGIP
jgi:FemAB-related protein (PEP-CTERM system-associated)